MCVYYKTVLAKFGHPVPTVSHDLTVLLGAIDQFRRRPSKGTRAEEEVALDLIQLRRGIDLLELEFSELAGAFAKTELADDWGSNSPIDWIRHECKMSSGAAADRVFVGTHLAQLPASTAAVAEGKIGFAHLSLIGRTAQALSYSGTATQPFDEAPLLHKAQESSVGKLWYHCNHLRHMADAQGYARQELEAIEARRLKLSSCEDGSLLIDGWLDSTGGAALRSALEPLARFSGAGDDRCRERRLADALVELAGHALDTGQVPQLASQRTHLQVTATLDTLRGLPGCAAGDLEFSIPISAKAVERLACDCTLTRVVLGSDSVVIDVGRAKRVVSGPTRKALNTRDASCRWPGCDRPASWSVAHHLVHWTKGGNTDLDNLVLLCWRHHTMVHEGGWQLVQTDEGRLLTIPPLPPGVEFASRGPVIAPAPDLVPTPLEPTAPPPPDLVPVA
jgi:hypothetical protein